MLKLILLIVIVLAVLCLARAGRRRVNPPAARPGPGAPSAREAMVSCAQCGLHLPSGEALPGRGGVFCSEGHRAAYEKEHAPK